MDRVYAIKVDTSSNVYVTGTNYASGTAWDYTTIKYDSSGNELWEEGIVEQVIAEIQQGE